MKPVYKIKIEFNSGNLGTTNFISSEKKKFDNNVNIYLGYFNPGVIYEIPTLEINNEVVNCSCTKKQLTNQSFQNTSSCIAVSKGNLTKVPDMKFANTFSILIKGSLNYPIDVQATVKFYEINEDLTTKLLGYQYSDDNGNYAFKVDISPYKRYGIVATYIDY